ncbi:unnamed protein product, partial [Phaeothamnion confervicola]
MLLVGLGFGKQRGFGKIEINAQLSGDDTFSRSQRATFSCCWKGGPLCPPSFFALLERLIAARHVARLSPVSLTVHADDFSPLAAGPVLLLPSRSFSTKGGLAAPISMLFLQRACAEGPADRRHRFLLCLPLIVHIGKCGSGGGSACSGGSRCAVIRWYWSEAQPCREQCSTLPRPAVLSDPLRAERPPQPQGGRVHRLRSGPR